MSNARTLANTINSSSQIVVPSGGIAFTDLNSSNDAATANEAYVIGQDGYETGTWTPTNYTGQNASISANNYTKIGRLVTVSCYFANGTFSGNTIGGLPFTSLAYGIGSIAYSNSTNVDGITSLNSTIIFRQGTNSVIPNNHSMMLSVTYQIP